MPSSSTSSCARARGEQRRADEALGRARHPPEGAARDAPRPAHARPDGPAPPHSLPSARRRAEHARGLRGRRPGGAILSRGGVGGDFSAEVHAAIDAAGMLTTETWAAAPDEVRRDLEAGRLSPIEAPPGEEELPSGKDLRKAPWVEPENPVLAAAREALARREVDAVLVPWPGFREAMTEGRRAEASIYFDSVRPDSTLARGRLDRALRTARREARSAREAARTLPSGFTDPLSILDRNVAPLKRRAGELLGTMMPLMMIMMSLLGGFLPAIDLTAGEKERGTMQTLLCAPLRPIEIIVGKFLAVFVVSLLTALVNVLSLSFTIRRLIPFEVAIAASTYALTFLALVPVSFFFSAIFLAVASFARDFRDGQNALAPVYILTLVTTTVTVLPGFEVTRGPRSYRSSTSRCSSRRCSSERPPQISSSSCCSRRASGRRSRSCSRRGSSSTRTCSSAASSRSGRSSAWAARPANCAPARRSRRTRSSSP